MGLREQAEQDLSFIMEDRLCGWGWDIKLTNPDGDELEVIGFSNDIQLEIDPDTGTEVNSRHISVAVRLSTLYDAGFTIPQENSNNAVNPWIIEFLDINLNDYRFTVVKSNPDRALGIVTLELGFLGE